MSPSNVIRTTLLLHLRVPSSDLGALVDGMASGPYRLRDAHRAPDKDGACVTSVSRHLNSDDEHDAYCQPWPHLNSDDGHAAYRRCSLSCVSHFCNT